MIVDSLIQIQMKEQVLVLYVDPLKRMRIRISQKKESSIKQNMETNKLCQAIMLLVFIRETHEWLHNN
jgi:hypothetical protein